MGAEAHEGVRESLCESDGMITPTKRYQKYYWAEMKVGDTHFRLHADMRKVIEAWRIWRRSNPEAEQWLIRFRRTRNGLIYERVR